MDLSRDQCSLDHRDIYETKKLERCLKMEGIEPFALWYYSRIFKFGHKSQQTSPVAVVKPGSSRTEIRQNSPMSYYRSTF